MLINSTYLNQGSAHSAKPKLNIVALIHSQISEVINLYFIDIVMLF